MTAPKASASAKSGTYKILLMGASYGSLLASKLLFGGHSIHLVCLPAEADLLDDEALEAQRPEVAAELAEDPVRLYLREIGEVKLLSFHEGVLTDDHAERLAGLRQVETFVASGSPLTGCALALLIMYV